jgi:hypothetical protein
MERDASVGVPLQSSNTYEWEPLCSVAVLWIRSILSRSFSLS